MNPEHWQRVKDLLNAALEVAPPERDDYLDKQCGSDAALRNEVQSLLASYDEAGDDFMDGVREEPPAATLKTDDPFVGMRVGPYRVIEEIGHGGMGTVFRAVRADDAYRKQVAIKVVRRGMSHDFVLRRFRHERQIMATLEHPNIARLLDGGATEDGLPYFVMEYVQRGEPIDTYCDRNQLNTRERLELFRQICSAVQAAHERQIIHRDIKPTNILVNSRGEPKLLDFGIAKILDPELATQTVDPTMTALRMMTPEYASPEQVRGDSVTEASDVYSLGVLLYELLSGHRPYRLKSRSPQEIAQVICESEPERPSTAVNRTELVTRGGTNPPITVTPESVGRSRKAGPDELRRTLAGDLDNIVLMAMRKEPSRRYSSAAELAQDIERYLAGQPIRARKTTTLYRVFKGVQRNRPAVLAAGLALTVAALSVFLWRTFVEKPVAPSAQPNRFTPFTSLVGDETQPAFSPDGRSVAFVWTGENGNNSDIYVKSFDGQSLRRITTNPAEDLSPTWSPDGKQVAFLRVSEHETSVFVAPVDGGTHGKITFLYPNRIEAVGRHLSWSPDGKYLAASDKKRPDDPFSIVLIELATGHKLYRTTPGPGLIGDSSPAFSPDGRSLVFIRGRSSGVDDIFTIPANGQGEPFQVTNDRRYIISASWTADSRALLFSSNRSGGQALWRVPAGSGEPERIFVPGDNASDPVFSPDGRRIAYSQFYLDANIWSVTKDGAANRLIGSTQYDSSPQFSPDMKRLAFRSSRTGSNEIWIADADGRNEYQLTSFNNTLTGTPRWSPDGRTIACDSRPEGQPDIYLVDVETRKVSRFSVNPAEDVVASFSRDGKWVYFASNRSGSWQVWRKAVTGGEAVQVTKDGGFAAFESPDGKFLYYAKGRSVAGLWRKSLPDGAEEEVLRGLKPGFWGYWAVCDHGVIYADRTTSQSLPSLFHLAGGGSTLFAKLGKPIMIADSGLAVTDDCSRVVVTQTDQSGSDIMLGEFGR